MILRIVFTLSGLLLGVAVAIGGLFAWTYLFGNPYGSLFDDSLDAYNLFEKFLIGCALAGGLLGYWVGGKVGRSGKVTNPAP